MPIVSAGGSQGGGWRAWAVCFVLSVRLVNAVVWTDD